MFEPLTKRERLSRLLIVEDDLAQLRTLSDIMREEGLHVTACVSAAEAIHHLASEAYGIVILDLRLPDHDGTRLLEKIRTMNGKIRVIIHTGYGSFDSARDALNRGAFAYVEKLADPAELVQQVHRAMSEHIQQYAAELEAAVEERTAELRESESRLQSIVDTVVHGIIVVDTSGAIDSFNRAAESLFDYESKEVLGKDIVLLVPSWNSTDPRRRVDAEDHPGEPTHPTGGRECLGKRKDGSTFLIDLDLSEMPLESRRMCVGIIRDISERKRFEERMRQSQKMEAVGRLAGGVAHDFNNYLTVINGYSQMLLDLLPSQEAAHGFAQEITQAGESAASLTRQLLVFSRDQVISPSLLNLNLVVARMEKMLSRLISEEIELVTRLDQNLGLVEADQGQIEQIIMNLAVNARDAMPRGGKILIETANCSWSQCAAGTPTTKQADRYAMFALTDTGMGMDEETKARLFEPFFTTKAEGKGTGLGLATVYGIVKKSNGSIDFSTRPGEGTTFRVYLPCVESPATSPRASTPLDEVPGGKESILLVEDQDEVRILARRVLQRKGYTILEASGGAAALDLIAHSTDTLDLLITDMIMPHMRGNELAESLTQQRPNLKVLYISGYTDSFIINFASSNTAFLGKPFRPEALARSVRDLLDRKSTTPAD